VIEAQYRNLGKDIEAVSDHYLQRDYSVGWLDEDDFSQYDVDISGILTVWPYALPDRTGREGYPAITRWLWQEQSPVVSLEIPIPGEYWASFDKSEEWVTVAQRDLRKKGRAWATISRSPTGQLTLQFGKKEWGWNGDTHRVTVQLDESDTKKLRSFTAELERLAFGSERPCEGAREPQWHDLTTIWLAGSPRINSWLSASLSPDNDVVLSLGKKHANETDRVSIQIDETVTQALDELTALLERAFQRESNPD
jgi:hypothetical protein